MADPSLNMPQNNSFATPTVEHESIDIVSGETYMPQKAIYSAWPDSKAIAEKMHIFSQMQGQPPFSESLLRGLEILDKGLAFSYMSKRAQEVTKLSEIEAMWTFLEYYTTYSSSGESSL